MKQIYRRTPMQSNFIEITLRRGCSPVNLLHIFRTSFLKNTSGRLLLYPPDFFLARKNPVMYGKWNRPIFREQSTQNFTFGYFSTSWKNLIQETKIICLRSNLVPSLIWICWVWWWCLLYLHLTEDKSLFG